MSMEGINFCSKKAGAFRGHVGGPDERSKFEASHFSGTHSLIKTRVVLRIISSQVIARGKNQSRRRNMSV